MANPDKLTEWIRDAVRTDWYSDDTLVARTQKVNFAAGIDVDYDEVNDKVTVGTSSVVQAGLAFFGSADSSVEVSITPRDDTNYSVAVSINEVSGTASLAAYLIRVADKTTTGFTIVLFSAPGGSATVRIGWVLVPYEV